MYDNNKQFLFRDSSDNIWRFYNDKRIGLCFSKQGNKNIWTSPVLIHKDIYSAFFVDMDCQNAFHIIFQDRRGNIYYCKVFDGIIDTLPVLESKFPSAYNKYFTLIAHKNVVHLLYILNHNESVILSYQAIIDNQVTIPHVVDYVADGIVHYKAVFDGESNIYAFYESSDGKYLQIGYKRYNITQNRWSEFIPVTRNPANCEHLFVIMDASKSLHLCYQRYMNKRYELVHQLKFPGKDVWTSEKVIYASIHPTSITSIAYIKSDIIVHWQKDKIIYFIISRDGGNSFGKPNQYSMLSGREIVNLSYVTNSLSEKGRIVAPNLPGVISTNGFMLAFYQSPKKSTLDDMTATQFKDTIINGLNLLKSNMDELRKFYEEVINTVTKLQNINVGLRKNIAKLCIRMDSLEENYKAYKSNLSEGKDFSLCKNNLCCKQYKLLASKGKKYIKKSTSL